MKNNEKNALSGLGKAFIALGLVLLGIKLDLLGLGAPVEYYKWEVVVIFFGLIALFNLNVVFSVILFAVALYFLLPEMALKVPDIVKTIFWPSMLVLAGLEFMLKPHRCRRQS
jgi:hypothetical protein